MNTPDISIVVCTHNRAAMLGDALASLAQLQTEQRFRYEIVVVDNASSDSTADVVAQVAANCASPIRYVYEGKKGIATARNRGLREAAGQWIAFFDDDQLADPAWLRTLYAYAVDYNLLAVGGSVFLQLPEGCERVLHPFVRMLLGESRHSSEPLAYSPKISPGTGNLMLHRSVFTQVGAFNEVFATRAEDTDLYMRMWSAGIEAWYVPAAIVHHVTPPLRLQTDYLHRLATFMGDGIADRERAARSPYTFLPRALAKSTLSPLLIATELLTARVLCRREAEVGLQCRLQLAYAYARRACELVRRDLAQLAPGYSAAFNTPKPA